MQSNKILVTGGAGYIGSTISSALEDGGYIPVILDDLSTGPIEHVGQRLFYKGDFSDKALLQKIVLEHKIDGVIHCAAKIKVSESVHFPYDYYECNVIKSISFLKHLVDLKLTNVVFSSTAAVYASSDTGQVDEFGTVNPQSPYAKSKYMIEQVIEDFREAYGLNAIILRYFNVIGADPLLRSGPYDPSPSHILGKLVSVFNKIEKEFVIAGTDWPTRDGSGIRDYIHVWDLALAHVAAVRLLLNKKENDKFVETINLGTGSGVTVKEFIIAFQEAVGTTINVSTSVSRVGDIAGAYTRIEKAKEILRWTPSLTVSEAIRHSIAWDKKRNHGKKDL